MKKFILGMALLASVSAMANTVSKGEATWNKSAELRFSVLETQGITMDALDKALTDCRKENDICVLKASEIVSDIPAYMEDGRYRRVMTLRTTVHAVDDLYIAGLLEKGREAITEEETWYTGTSFGTLEHLGLRFDALSSALSSCYNQGFDLCAILNSELTESNSPHDDGKLHSTGRAMVRGYKLKLGGFKKVSLGKAQLLPAPSVKIPSLSKQISI